MGYDPDLDIVLDQKADIDHTHMPDHTHPGTDAALADHETRLAALENVVPVEPPPVEPPAELGIPCGWFYDWPTYYSQWLSEFPHWSGGTVVAPPTIARLNDFRAHGLSVVLNFSGFHGQLLTDGLFDIDKWKALVDISYGLGLESYIEDGTIQAHYMIDEPTWPGSWGETITSDVLDSLGAYSKNYWPTLPCVIRDTPVSLVNHAAGRNTPWPGGYDWQYADGCWLQYKAMFGPVATWREAQMSAANTLGMSVVPGLNWRDGGDGSSGITHPGTSELWWVCTPTEVTTYSQALMSNEIGDPAGFFMWSFPNDPIEPAEIINYKNSAPMQAAFDTLRDFCAAKEWRSLLKRPG